jgi:hypothetical protein
MKPQNTKKCAIPGTFHFSRRAWPKTSTTCPSSRLGQLSRRPGDGLPGGDHPVQEEHAPTGDGQPDHGDRQADHQAHEHVRFHGTSEYGRRTGHAAAAEAYDHACRPSY